MIRAVRSHGEHPHETGVALMRQGDPVAAVAAFRRAIAQNPELFWSYQKLGDALIMLGRWDEAADAYRQAIARNPLFVLSHCSLGDVLAQLGRHDQAVECFAQALAVQPDFAPAAAGMARALAQMGPEREAEARKWYLRACELAPDDLTLHHERLSLLPIDPVWCQQVADRLADQGKWMAAIHFYQVVRQLRPDDALVWIGLAQVLMRQGEFEHAILCYHRAIARAGSCTLQQQADIHHGLGKALLGQHRFAEATDAFAQACALAADDAGRHKQLGDLLAFQNRIAEAAAAYQRAVELGYGGIEAESVPGF